MLGAVRVWVLGTMHPFTPILSLRRSFCPSQMSRHGQQQLRPLKEEAMVQGGTAGSDRGMPVELRPHSHAGTHIHLLPAWDSA